MRSSMTIAFGLSFLLIAYVYFRQPLRGTVDRCHVGRTNGPAIGTAISIGDQSSHDQRRAGRCVRRFQGCVCDSRGCHRRLGPEQGGHRRERRSIKAGHDSVAATQGNRCESRSREIEGLRVSHDHLDSLARSLAVCSNKRCCKRSEWSSKLPTQPRTSNWPAGRLKSSSPTSSASWAGMST